MTSRRTLDRRDAEAHPRSRLTPAQRKAVAALMHGRRHARPVTVSNMTTPASRWATMPLFVARATADKLVAEAYATCSWVDGADHIQLTETGVYRAEQEGL